MTLNKTKFLEAKAQGKNNTQAALAAGSKSTNAAEKAGWRLSNTVSVQRELQRAVKQSGITMQQCINVFADAMTADKQTTDDDGNIIFKPDYTTRMKAAERFMKLMGVDQAIDPAMVQPAPTNQLKDKKLLQALQEADEVQLLGAVFKTNS